MKTKACLWPLLLPFAGACAWWMAGRPGVKKADEVIFSHAKHRENDVECSTCHAGINEAKDTKASHRPAEKVCLDCHERDNCAMCHTDVAASAKPYAANERQLGFSHQAHVLRATSGCSQCHADIDGSKELLVATVPMSVCLGCHLHRDQYAEARCLSCHPSMQQLPLRAVAEFDHGGDWTRRHGLQARAQGASCLQCHGQTACSECHSRVPAAVNVRLYPEAVERELLHRGDWRSTHALEARADGAMCQRCHTDSNFCVACHRASGLTPGLEHGRVPHPPGWASPGSRSFHGEEARLHIETCVPCHDQGATSNCVSCHKVGGVGGNPHPAGWRKSHESGDEHEEPMCRVCHGGVR